MQNHQFSIRRSLAVVAFVALSCAALVRPSFFLAGCLWAISLSGLALGLVAVICKKPPDRVFWLGYSIFGWGHMVLALAPWFDDRSGEFILTRQLLDRLGSALGHDVSDTTSMPGIWHNLPYAIDGVHYGYLTYLVAGQSAFTILIAVAGGFASRFLVVDATDSGD